MKVQLTIEQLISEAKVFCENESNYENPDLFGITDGKAVGTFIEHKFQDYLLSKYEYERGFSASGIDFPSETINTDMKVTSIRQPQSSCPFKSARQKIYGLGYNLLLFVYNKVDDSTKQSSKLDFLNCTFIYKNRTADYQITKTLIQMIENDANIEEIIAYLMDKNLPADEIKLNSLADEILKNPPIQGYLTVSNALQWRLQYSRIVKLEDDVNGIIKIIQKHD